MPLCSAQPSRDALIIAAAADTALNILEGRCCMVQNPST